MDLSAKYEPYLMRRNIDKLKLPDLFALLDKLKELKNE